MQGLHPLAQSTISCLILVLIASSINPGKGCSRRGVLPCNARLLSGFLACSSLFARVSSCVLFLPDPVTQVIADPDLHLCVLEGPGSPASSQVYTGSFTSLHRLSSFTISALNPDFDSHPVIWLPGRTTFGYPVPVVSRHN